MRVTDSFGVRSTALALLTVAANRNFNAAFSFATGNDGNYATSAHAPLLLGTLAMSGGTPPFNLDLTVEVEGGTSTLTQFSFSARSFLMTLAAPENADVYAYRYRISDAASGAVDGAFTVTVSDLEIFGAAADITITNSDELLTDNIAQLSASGGRILDSAKTTP